MALLNDVSQPIHLVTLFLSEIPDTLKSEPRNHVKIQEKLFEIPKFQLEKAVDLALSFFMRLDINGIGSSASFLITIQLYYTYKAIGLTINQALLSHLSLQITHPNVILVSEGEGVR